MSFRNSAVACSIIRKMATHMQILIGAMGGRQAVRLRSPYSSA